VRDLVERGGFTDTEAGLPLAGKDVGNALLGRAFDEGIEVDERQVQSPGEDFPEGGFAAAGRAVEIEVHA